VLPAEISVAGERLVLHPHRALYWDRLRWLVVSDLHLGKAAHFRKAGAALPEGQDEATLARLDAVIANFRPERLLILGDLFHSSHNNSWAPFTAWALRQNIALHLVPGNHDILADRRYAEAGITVRPERWTMGGFQFAHADEGDKGGCTISGHVHPGVVLAGRGRQSMRLPCFLINDHRVLLPAFGTSTGTFVIQPGRMDRVYACTDSLVLEVTNAVVPPVRARG
jgi:uncharacterized protein